VASRADDDFLWAEIVNFGGYDVLPHPFERDELKRVVASAHRHFALQSTAPKPRRGAAGWVA
jgi:hypothetical protein